MENLTDQKSRLPLMQRVAQIAADPQFKEQCGKYRNIELFNYLGLIEKVALLDISNIPTNNRSLKMDYPADMIVDETLSFYADLDRICPELPLLSLAEKNMQYLTFEPNYSRLKPGELPRSACGISSVTLPSGETVPKREIFVYLDGDFRTIFSGAHEFAHSMSDRFLKLEYFKSNAVAELVPSIVDVFAPELFLQHHPEFAPQVAELKKLSLVNTVKKARQSLLEACVVKVMTGEMQLEDVMQKYSNIFNEQLISDCVSDIEQDLFKPMHEAQYVLPHVMAETLFDMFKQNPQETVKNIKSTLSCDTRLSLEEAYSVLRLPRMETTLANFNSKLNEHAMSR